MKHLKDSRGNTHSVGDIAVSINSFDEPSPIEKLYAGWAVFKNGRVELDRVINLTKDINPFRDGLEK